jgi:hypothetical protein
VGSFPGTLLRQDVSHATQCKDWKFDMGKHTGNVLQEPFGKLLSLGRGLLK